MNTSGCPSFPRFQCVFLTEGEVEALRFEEIRARDSNEARGALLDIEVLPGERRLGFWHANVFYRWVGGNAGPLGDGLLPDHGAVERRIYQLLGAAHPLGGFSWRPD